MKGRQEKIAAPVEKGKIAGELRAPDSMVDCVKLVEDLKIRQSELETRIAEKNSEINKLVELNTAIVNHAELIMIATDLNGLITSMNPFAEKMLGYRSEEVVGKHTPLFFYDPAELRKFTKGSSEEDASGYSYSFEEILSMNLDADRRSKGVERTYVRKDGSRFRGLLTVSPIRDERMEPIGFVGIIVDITERKLNEHYLNLHRDLGFDLAATSSIGAALSKVLKAMLRIEDVHAAGIYLLNTKTEDFELVVFDGNMLKHRDDLARYKPNILYHEALQQGNPVYGEFKGIIKNSELFISESLNQFGVIPIRYENTLIGTVNIASGARRPLSEGSKIAVEMLASQIGGTLSRLKSEEALHQSRKNFQLIFDTLDDFVFVFDARGNIIRTNPAVEKKLGYTPEELCKMTIFEVHPAARKNEVKSMMKKILDRRLSVCSIPLVSREGEFIPVETKILQGKWYEDDVLYGISRDITERQRAETGLHMLSSAFEVFALSIVITDVEGNIQWANSSFLKLSGYTLPEILGKNPRQIVKSDKQDRAFYKSMWDTILAGEVWRGELINRRKDGSYFPEELTITPVKNHAGELTNFIAIKIDITRRKEMETALRMSEERWNFALEGSGEGVFDWNLVANEVYFSDRWKTMLGYEPFEIENKYEEWEKRVHPDDLESALDDFNDHFNGKTPFYMNEHRILGKDGTYRWILARGKIVEKTMDGKPSRIIGTHRDITSRKLKEEQLRKSMEMERELSELKSRFVAMASHEFRTPLASILMISDTLIKHQEKMSSANRIERLLKINNHVFHLSEIVGNVLQLSKIQEGNIGFNPTDVDLIETCRSIVEEYASADRLKNGRIRFASPYRRLVARVDRRLMIQTVTNLVSNAVKYSLEVPFVDVELEQENRSIVIRVRDAGIGVPEEDEKLLFIPFFRAGNASAIQGNGLGLAIASESVLLHGGRLTYARNRDKGSTFSVLLPEKLISVKIFEEDN